MSNGETSNEYPLDVTVLRKGQVFSVEELEAIFSIPRASELWPFRVMSLQRFIAKRRRDLGLCILTTRTHKGTLIICDDADAARYNHQVGKRGIRKFGRALHRNLAVDQSKLSAQERELHTKAIMRQAMIAAAIRQVSHRKPPVEGPARTAPPMVAGPG